MDKIIGLGILAIVVCMIFLLVAENKERQARRQGMTEEELCHDMYDDTFIRGVSAKCYKYFTTNIETQ